MSALLFLSHLRCLRRHLHERGYSTSAHLISEKKKKKEHLFFWVMYIKYELHTRGGGGGSTRTKVRLNATIEQASKERRTGGVEGIGHPLIPSSTRAAAPLVFLDHL